MAYPLWTRGNACLDGYRSCWLRCCPIRCFQPSKHSVCHHFRSLTSLLYSRSRLRFPQNCFSLLHRRQPDRSFLRGCPACRLVLSRGDYHWQHEPCLYAVKKTGKGHWAGDRKQTTLWQIANKDQDSDTVHGTQKPVECMRRPILNNSSPGQAVYEPFMGSGTTLIAAETTGRVCLGIELNPAYVDVAVERWQQFTGKDAVLSGSGEAFDKIKTKDD